MTSDFLSSGICFSLSEKRVSLVAQLLKNPPAMKETLVGLLGQEDPLGKAQTTHSSILGLPWRRVVQIVKNPQYRRSGFDPWVGKIPWRRAWQPTPVFLPGEFPWMEEPGRLQSMRSQRVRHNSTIKLTHTF